MALDLIRKPRGFYDKEKFCEKRLCLYIENRRMEMGINQKDLAELIGISQQAFSKRVKRETGKCNLSEMQLAKILKRLKATDEERASLLDLD